MEPLRRDPDPRPSGPEHQTGLASSTELTRRAREGDPEALGEMLHRNKERLRRIVAIRLAARLARVLEDELSEEAVRTALLATRETDLASEADLVGFLAKLVEREVRRRPDRPAGEERERPRTLRFDEPEADPRRTQREDLERVVDARVAALEPDEYREVLILRDYCAADWELVRARLGLLSVEQAQELYRRAHEKLARRVRAARGR